MLYNFKDITDVSKREPNEYYLGDHIQVKKPNEITKRNCVIVGYNHKNKKWIVKYDNTSADTPYDEITDENIIELKGNVVEINTNKEIHPYMLEIEKLMNKE